MIPIVSITREPQLAESEPIRCFKLLSLLEIAMSVSPFACASVVRAKVEELVKNVIKFTSLNFDEAATVVNCQTSY